MKLLDDFYAHKAINDPGYTPWLFARIRPNLLVKTQKYFHQGLFESQTALDIQSNQSNLPSEGSDYMIPLKALELSQTANHLFINRNRYRAMKRFLSPKGMTRRRTTAESCHFFLRYRRNARERKNLRFPFSAKRGSPLLYRPVPGRIARYTGLGTLLYKLYKSVFIPNSQCLTWR